MNRSVSQSITHDDDSLPPRVRRPHSLRLPEHGRLRTDEIPLRLGDDDLGLLPVATAYEREVRVRAVRVRIKRDDALATPVTRVGGGRGRVVVPAAASSEVAETPDQQEHEEEEAEEGPDDDASDHAGRKPVVLVVRVLCHYNWCGGFAGAAGDDDDDRRRRGGRTSTGGFGDCFECGFGRCPACCCCWRYWLKRVSCATLAAG